LLAVLGLLGLFDYYYMTNFFTDGMLWAGGVPVPLEQLAARGWQPCSRKRLPAGDPQEGGGAVARRDGNGATGLFLQKAVE
jgi:hypothetical protein